MQNASAVLSVSISVSISLNPAVPCKQKEKLSEAKVRARAQNWWQRSRAWVSGSWPWMCFPCGASSLPKQWITSKWTPAPLPAPNPCQAGAATGTLWNPGKGLVLTPRKWHHPEAQQSWSTRGSSFREGEMIQVKPHYWLLMSSGSEFNFYRDTGEEWSVWEAKAAAAVPVMLRGLTRSQTWVSLFQPGAQMMTGNSGKNCLLY